MMMYSDVVMEKSEGIEPKSIDKLEERSELKF